MKSATKKLFESENFLTNHISAVLNDLNRRANIPKKPPRAPVSIWDIDDQIDYLPNFSYPSNIENLQPSNLEEKNADQNDLTAPLETNSYKSDVVFEDIYIDSEQPSNDGINCTDDTFQTKTRQLTPEKCFPSKKQCRVLDYKLNSSITEKRENHMNSQIETESNVYEVRLKNESLHNETVAENAGFCVNQIRERSLEREKTETLFNLPGEPRSNVFGAAQLRKVTLDSGTSFDNVSYPADRNREKSPSLNRNNSTVGLDCVEKLKTEPLGSKSPQTEWTPVREDLSKRSIDLELANANNRWEIPKKAILQYESPLKSGEESFKTETSTNLGSVVRREKSKMGMITNELSSQDYRLSNSKSLSWRSQEKFSESKGVENDNKNEKLCNNSNLLENKLSNQTFWHSSYRKNSFEKDTYESGLLTKQSDHKDFSDWLKERQQGWKSQKVDEESSVKCNNNITNNERSKLESPEPNTVKDDQRQQSWRFRKEVKVASSEKCNNNKTNNVASKIKSSELSSDDAEVNLNIGSVHCSEGDDSVICLLVTSSNGTVEVTVEKKVLEHVQTKIPALLEILPPIGDSEKKLSHSAEAVVMFLRFIFSSPYNNIQNWKVALELLYFGKKFNFHRLVEISEKFISDCNPSPTEMEEIIQYAKHLNMAEEVGGIYIPDNPLALQEHLTTVTKFRTNHKVQMIRPSCSISTKLYVEPFEFCIPLLKMQPHFKDSFKVDIRNELVFESVKGSFCITGIQIKLDSDAGDCEDKISVICDVSKGNEKLMSDEKEKNSKFLIIYNFNKKVVVDEREKVKIDVLIEDIPPCMCGRASQMKLTENVEGNHFVVSLSTSKTLPFIFIEKIFYTVNS